MGPMVRVVSRALGIFLESPHKVRLLRIAYTTSVLLILGLFSFDLCFKKCDDYSKDLSLRGASELQRVFQDNESLLIFIGTAIQKASRKDVQIPQNVLSKNILEFSEDILTVTPEISLSGLMTSYISLASSTGRVLVSGKSGIIKNPDKNICRRLYFMSALENPWKLVFSLPERSLFSHKFVLPTGMGITDARGNFLGYLLLGLQLNYMYERLDKISAYGSHKIFIYDVQGKKYLPRENPEETYLIEEDREQPARVILSRFPYEVHVKGDPVLFLVETLTKNPLYIFLLVLFGFLLSFQSEIFVIRPLKKLYSISKALEESSPEKINMIQVGKKTQFKEISLIIQYVNSLIDRYKMSFDQINLLIKGKQLSELSLKKREAFFDSSFVRIEKNVEELSVCLSLIENCDQDEKRKDFLARSKEILQNIKRFPYASTKLTSFSFNAVMEDALAYYANDIFERDINIIRNFSTDIPTMRGDEFFIRHLLISVLGKILENAYGVKHLVLKTNYIVSYSPTFLIVVEEHLVEGRGFFPVEKTEILPNLENTGVHFELKKEKNRRMWSITCTPPKDESIEQNRIDCTPNKKPRPSKRVLRIVPSHLDNQG